MVRRRGHHELIGTWHSDDFRPSPASWLLYDGAPQEANAWLLTRMQARR